MGKKAGAVLGAAVVLLAGVLAARFILGGDEDTWICREGEWMKHGNPAAEKPAAPCLQFKVSVPAWEDGGLIPQRYTCDGENISPPMMVEGLPEKAASWMAVMHDPDAPAGDFTHWVIWNISGQATTLEEGRIPPGAVEGRNDFGRNGYGGPCPPSGRHRYYLEVRVLDKYLDAGAGADLAKVQEEAAGHVIARGQWLGVYR